MEEKEKYEVLKSTLEKIEQVIKLYNDLDPEQKLSITTQEEKKDVSDTFLCVYNNKHVGLFKKINWSTETHNIDQAIGYAEYNAGSVYVGINSNYIGMKETHSYNMCINHWQPIGKKIIIDDKSYVSNCVMQKGMSFDDMRLIMYNDGQIGPYEIGKASSKEIIDVLKYSYSYYELNQNFQKEKLKLK